MASKTKRASVAEHQGQSEQSPRKVIYVPPDDKVFDDLARRTCATLAEQENDPHYTDFEVVTGLADFLKLIARLQAKKMNKMHEEEQTKSAPSGSDS